MANIIMNGTPIGPQSIYGWTGNKFGLRQEPIVGGYSFALMPGGFMEQNITIQDTRYSDEVTAGLSYKFLSQSSGPCSCILKFNYDNDGVDILQLPLTYDISQGNWVSTDDSIEARDDTKLKSIQIILRNNTKSTVCVTELFANIDYTTGEVTYDSATFQKNSIMYGMDALKPDLSKGGV